MRLLIDATGASGAGSGRRWVEEAGQELHGHASRHALTFAVRPELRSAVTTPMRAAVPPRAAAAAPLRLAWQLAALPRSHEFDVAFGLFNLVATRWPRPAPRLAVMISNLLPFFEEYDFAVPRREVPRLLALRRLTHRAVTRADLVVFQSQFAADTLRDALDIKRSIIIGHGFRARPPRPPARIIDRPYVLVVGDQLFYKGIEDAILATAAIPRADRPLLVLAGSRAGGAYGRHLEALVAALGLEADVVSMGPLAFDETLGLMANAAVCVACSRFENLSRVPLEAMATGAPVICSDIPAHREIAGDAALYYPVGDAPALSASIQAVLAGGQLRDALRMRAQTHLPAHDVPVWSRLLPALEELVT
jgi:glycosyltransferase involved in cell wall biosynthesis